MGKRKEGQNNGDRLARETSYENFKNWENL